MGYSAKATTIRSQVKNTSEVTASIKNISFSSVWKGQAHDNLTNNLNKLLTKIESEKTKIESYAQALDVLQTYKDNKYKINTLYSTLYNTSNTEENTEERESLNYKISLIENENNQLREKLILNMSTISSSKVGSELSLSDYTITPLQGEYTEIPQMYQNDYKGIPYSQGDVASSGCGITCAAMVISYYTGKEVTPGELAEKYNIGSLSNAGKLVKALEDYGIKVENNWDAGYNFNEVKEKVSNEDCVAIMLMKEDSDFTSYGHFILATDVNEEGRYEINDPYKPNYNSSVLKDGFENGFEDWQVKKGWSGCWVIESKESYLKRQAENTTQ